LEQTLDLICVLAALCLKRGVIRLGAFVFRDESDDPAAKVRGSVATWSTMTCLASTVWT
jgi:hypothetical protein